MLSDCKSPSIVCGSSKNDSQARSIPYIRGETGTERDWIEPSVAPYRLFRPRPNAQTLDKCVLTFWETTLQLHIEQFILGI